VPYNFSPRHGIPVGKPKIVVGETPMKKVIRIAVLMLVAAGIFASATVPQVAALDGGMIKRPPVKAITL